QKAQVAGELRIRIVDRLVLADHAAQLCGKRARARLQRRVGKHLVRIDREGRNCGKQKGAGKQQAADHWAASSAALTLRAFCGAPTRRRRSKSETVPPTIMISVPIQMQRIIGFHQTRTTTPPSAIPSPRET